MTEDPGRIAAALQVGIGQLVRRLRQVEDISGLTLPEISALAKLDRDGPATSSALARLAQISPQSMGATLGGLQSRGLIEGRPDPDDGRRIVLSPTDAGRDLVRSRRSGRIEAMATALARDFTPAERATLAAAAPLIERLAQRI